MSILSITAKKQLLPLFDQNLTLAYKHLRLTEEGLNICRQLHQLSNRLSLLTKSSQLSTDHLKEMTVELLTINQQIHDKKVTERFETIGQIMAKLSGNTFPAPLPAAPLMAQEPTRKSDLVDTTKVEKPPETGQSVVIEPSPSVQQNTIEIADLGPLQPEPQTNDRIALRLEKQNKRAFDLMSKANTPYLNYPYTQESKASFLSSRTQSRSPVQFSNRPFQDQIYSETRPLSSCAIHIACAQGHKREMEDRLLAISLQFQANGRMYTADLFGVFDGHGGSQTVDLVVGNLAKYLQNQLETRLQDKHPNDDNIFYALREAVDMAHQGCVSKQFSSGTTAIFGFKLTDSHEIWTANVGDSSAVLDRKGDAIPMSIEQKPLYLYDPSVENAPPYSPNKYAADLLKKNVLLNDGKNFSEQDILLGRKMVMTSLGKDSDNTHHLVLGIPNKHHLDMSRSIGDFAFNKWKKASPEIFKQTLQPGDLLILHSDGVKALPKTVVEIIEVEKQNRTPINETLEHLVQGAIRDKDNVCAMIVCFNEN